MNITWYDNSLRRKTIFWSFFAKHSVRRNTLGECHFRIQLSECEFDLLIQRSKSECDGYERDWNGIIVTVTFECEMHIDETPCLLSFLRVEKEKDAMY